MSSELIVADSKPVEIGFSNEASFSLAERAARLLSSSTLVPINYQGDANLGNCVIALHMASRLKADPILVMQNLHIIQGKPSWGAPFLIAMFNSSGLFSKLRYRMTGNRNDDSFGCVAYATELSTGETLEGTEVTVAIAKAEGWYTKSGSKWKTMPEQMLKYRAAAWFIRSIAPELAMGLHTADEVDDFSALDVNVPSKSSEQQKPIVSPMELLKQKQHAPVAAVAAAVPSTQPTPQASPAASTPPVEQPEPPVASVQATSDQPGGGAITPEPGFCTREQHTQIESLFARCGFDTDGQRTVLAKRGVGAIRSLTVQQASELIVAMENKLASLAANQAPEPSPTPQQPIGQGTPHPPGAMQCRVTDPCTPAQVKSLEDAIVEWEQVEPGASESFLINMADRELAYEDLTIAQCDELIQAIKAKSMNLFFEKHFPLEAPVAQ